MCATITVRSTLGFVLAMGVSLASVRGDDEKPLRSERVSLGDGDFRLMVAKGRQITMEWSRDKAETVKQVVNPTPTLDESGKEYPWSVAIRDGNIVDVALSRWHRRLLIAVLTIEHRGTLEYWCLAFRYPSMLGKRDELDPGATFVGASGMGHQVLAVSGDREGPSICIVIGANSVEEPELLASGLITWHGCPNPGPVGARVGRFAPHYDQ